MTIKTITNSLNTVYNWWHSIPNELYSTISQRFKGKSGELMSDSIGRNASSYLARAKLERKAIIIHPHDSLLRSLVVTPQGDFFLLLNRHSTENDPIVGAGSFKQVSLALHLNSGHTFVSLRALNESPIDKKDNAIELANSKALAALDQCTHITHSVEYTAKGNQKIRFFSPLCKDGDLDTAIVKDNLTKEQKDDLFTQICIAVCEMHQLGIIHRDLKPGSAKHVRLASTCCSLQ